VKLGIALFVPLCLAACGQDVRSLRLDEVDLTDMAQVQRLGQSLSPAERPAFTTFVAIHGRAEAGNCGLTLGGREARQPETIGEAIEAMQIRLAQVRPAPSASVAAPPPVTPEGVYTGPSLAEVNRQLEVLER
jgi:hypothetical protein